MSCGGMMPPGSWLCGSASRRITTGRWYLIIEGAQAPILHRHQAIQPQFGLVIDAGLFCAEPGEITLIDPDEALGGMGTHGLSMGDFLRYIQAETGSKTVILAIQAAGNEFGDPVCPPVKHAVNQAADQLHKILIRAGNQEGVKPALDNQ